MPLISCAPILRDLFRDFWGKKYVDLLVPFLRIALSTEQIPFRNNFPIWYSAESTVAMRIVSCTRTNKLVQLRIWTIDLCFQETMSYPRDQYTRDQCVTKARLVLQFRIAVLRKQSKQCSFMNYLLIIVCPLSKISTHDSAVQKK